MEELILEDRKINRELKNNILKLKDMRKELLSMKQEQEDLKKTQIGNLGSEIYSHLK